MKKRAHININDKAFAEYKDLLSTCTCSECGKINFDDFLIYSGGDKKSEYTCEGCKLKIERDLKIEDILK